MVMITVPSWKLFVLYQVLMFILSRLILSFFFINYIKSSLLISISFNPNVYFLNEIQQGKYIYCEINEV